jgi:ubiquinone/menaquinone biosynthesis C-methylase UbiE
VRDEEIMSASDTRIDTIAAEAYERHMVPGMFLQWAEFIVNVAQPRTGEHVLDVACATGIAARVASSHVGPNGRTVALDFDAGMIEVARILTSAAQIPIEWHCADALAMPFPDASFDLCLCLQGLQFLPDRVAGFAKIHRVLKPTGRLVAGIWGPREFNKGQHEIVEALERQHVDASSAKRAFSFSDPEDIRATAAHAGFQDIEVRTEDGVSNFPSMQAFFDAMTLGAPFTRRAVALLPEDGRERFYREVSAALARYVVAGRLAYPMRTHIVSARR